MAFDKDAFLSALDSMSVMELNDLVKAIEEKFGVSAAAMAAPGGGGGGGAAAPVGRRADRVHVMLPEIGANKVHGHQGRARADRPGPEGSQGPGRRRAEARQGSHGQGRRRSRARRSSRTPAPRPNSSNAASRRAGRRSPAPGLSRFPGSADAPSKAPESAPIDNRGFFQVISQESSLIRLQRTGLVGLRCNAGVVRQRQVVASHQASSARLERQSPTEVPAHGQARGFLRRSVHGAASNPL